VVIFVFSFCLLSCILCWLHISRICPRPCWRSRPICFSIFPLFFSISPSSHTSASMVGRFAFLIQTFLSHPRCGRLTPPPLPTKSRTSLKAGWRSSQPAAPVVCTTITKGQGRVCGSVPPRAPVKRPLPLPPLARCGRATSWSSTGIRAIPLHGRSLW